MSKRFGGRYSPSSGSQPDANAARPVVKTRRSKVGARVNFLFVAPMPLGLLAFGRDPVGLALTLAALGVLLGAAFLLREGLKAEEAYEARTVARRPAIPRKIFASILTGVGLALAGYANDAGLVAMVVFGVLGTVLHSIAFGFDPLKDKGAEGIDTYQTDRVARAVDEAEKQLAAMSDAILRVQDRQLELRVAGFQDTARAMFRQIEEDPRDLTAARKYLSVYLLGARDATTKFVDLYSRTRDAQARADYEALLTDLNDNFAARTDKMLIDDKSDLDVEIEVLRDRLAREGIVARDIE